MTKTKSYTILNASKEIGKEVNIAAPVVEDILSKFLTLIKEKSANVVIDLADFGKFRTKVTGRRYYNINTATIKFSKKAKIKFYPTLPYVKLIENLKQK